MNPPTTSGAAAGVRPSQQARARRRPSVLWLAPLACLVTLGFVSFRALDARRVSAADTRARAVAAPAAPATVAPRSAPRLAPVAPLAAAPPPTTAPETSDPGDQPASWQTFKAKLDVETTDPRWSESTAADIRKLVAGLALPGTTLVSARCRQTVCEAVFDHTSHDHQMQAPMALTKGPFMTGVHYRYDGLRTYAYLQRE
jgi:hypothetical protein